jgi:hypothetical protein
VSLADEDDGLFSSVTTEELRAELARLDGIPLRGVDELLRELMEEELEEREREEAL